MDMTLCTAVVANICIIGFLFLMMAIFGAIVAVRGMPERMERSRSEAHPVIGTFLIEYWMWLVVRPFEHVCLWLRLTPTAVTFLSLFLHAASGIFLALGFFTVGGWLFLLDGKLARLTGNMTRVGAFYDSVVDRYGEMMVLLGFGYYYFQIHHFGAGLAAMVGIGAMMVSYTRSRAEALHADARGGFMQRPERAFFIGIVTAADCYGTCFLEKGNQQPVHWPVIVVLALVALAANITAVGRIVSSVRELSKQDREQAGRQEGK
jgi:phosphatidylglycerophosphate synthase